MIKIEEAALTLNFDINDPSLDWSLVINAISKDIRFTHQTILLQPKLYSCRSQIVLGEQVNARPLAIHGSGPSDRSTNTARGSILFFPKPPTDNAIAMTIRAPGTEFKGFRIMGNATKSIPWNTCIRVESRIHFEDFGIMQWNNTGSAVIEMTSDHLRTENVVGSTAVSLATMERCYIYGVYGPSKGIWIHGGDAGTCTFNNLSIKDLEKGTAIHDESFLGCLWIGCHVHNERNSSIPIIADKRSSFASFIGCYIEGYIPAKIVPPNVWIGGVGLVNGGGTAISNGNIQGARIIAPTIVSQKYNPNDDVNVQRVFRIEVEDSIVNGKPSVDFIEAFYDGRIIEATNTPVRKNTYGYLNVHWKSIKEIYKTPMRIIRNALAPLPSGSNSP